MLISQTDCVGVWGAQLWCWGWSPWLKQQGPWLSPSNRLVSLSKSFSLCRAEFWIVAKPPRPGPPSLVGYFMTVTWAVRRGRHSRSDEHASYHFCPLIVFWLCVGEPIQFNGELVRKFLVLRCSESLLSSDAFYFPLENQFIKQSVLACTRDMPSEHWARQKRWKDESVNCRLRVVDVTN